MRNVLGFGVCLAWLTTAGACATSHTSAGGAGDAGPSLPPEMGEVTGACTSDGWCWDNPLPTGNVLRAVWAVAPNDVWIVGNRGTVVHWDGARWTSMYAPTEDDLTAVWASGPDDVWTIASSGSPPGSSMFHWNGTAWSEVTDPAFAAHAPDSIWGSSRTDIWVTGQGGPLHYDGSRWRARSDVAAGGNDSVVSGSGPHDVWITPGFEDGVITGSPVHWDGSHAMSTPWVTSEPNLHVGAVLAVAPDDAWLRTGGTLQHWDGATWSVVDGHSEIAQVSVYSASELFANAGAGGIWLLDGANVDRWNGSAWSASPAPASGFVAIASSGPDDVWLVGGLGTVSHWDGHAWTAVLPRSILPSTPDSFADAWTDGTTIRAIGTTRDGATTTSALYRFDGTSWTVEDVGASDPTLVSGSGPNDVWAAAADGFHHFDGSRWSPVASDADVSGGITALWARAPDEAWAATATGPYMTAPSVVHWDGTAWTTWAPWTTWVPPLPTYAMPDQATVTTFGGSASDDVWIVDNFWYPTAEAAVVHWDGSTLTSVTSFSGWRRANVRVGILPEAANDAWLATCEGVVHVVDGVGVDSATFPILETNYGCSYDADVLLARESGGRLWAAGTAASAITSNGGMWSPSDTGAQADLYGLVITSDGAVRAFGDGATILRHDYP